MPKYDVVHHKVVSNEDWLAARKALLAKEKEFTRLRDELSQARRDLPWEKVTKDYAFEGPNGKATLADLFAGKSQLLVYHFMFGPEWQEGCKSCSFWADNYDPVIVHLNQRDVTMVAVSRGPLAKLEAFKRRMGWRFPWYSSAGSDFNFDYKVSFTPQQLEAGRQEYNYAPPGPGKMDELPGMSAFYKNPRGEIFHTYSCYARGLDMLNTAYHHLDLVPKGRDEENLPYTMAWVKHRDKY